MHLPATDPLPATGALGPLERARFAGAARWYDAVDPDAPPRPPVHVPRWLGVPMLLAALGCSVAIPSLVLGMSVAVMLSFGAVFTLMQRPRLPPLLQPPERPRRGLELNADGLVFHPGGYRRSSAAPQPLLSTAGPFGVTLVASHRRDRLVAVLTSSAGTFFIGAVFDGGLRRAFAALLARASTLAGDDAVLEAVGPDGEPLLMDPAQLGSLVEALSALDPACAERLVLTDVRGAALTLDGRKLSAGDRTVDLTAPLEWRSLLFQESLGQSITFYQGTWIRQGPTELVLVSLLPSLSVEPGGEDELAGLDRGALRDIRLMQTALEEAPPPAEQRVAIEQLFMLPVRSALERACSTTPQPPRARA